LDQKTERDNKNDLIALVQYFLRRVNNHTKETLWISS